MSDDLLSIGSFALLTGLSVPALRHYDEVGVLRPAFVDPRTRYRFYRLEQVRSARLISALRAVDVPIDEIRDVVEENDEAYLYYVLTNHRERLRERAHVVNEQLEALNVAIEKGLTMTMVKGARIVGINIAVTDLEKARRFYEDALDCEFAEEKHGDGPVHLNATFGDWGKDNWFLVSLWPNPSRAGSVDIGFLVEDLDATYKKALAAGGADIHQPMDKPGMPRNAYVKDPSGNTIGLYQG